MLIRIELDSEDAEEISKAIQVDNVDLPQGMEIEVKGGDGKVTIVLKVRDAESILTLRNTADEILTHVDALIKVLSKGKGNFRT